MIADELARILRRVVPDCPADADPGWVADVRHDLCEASVMIAEALASIDCEETE